MTLCAPEKTRQSPWLSVGCALLTLAAWPALASDYPTKPIELIVQFPAGSSADVVARVLADGMSKHVGQNVIVVNRPGAGGALAYKHVQAAKPDGYTLVFNSSSISTVHYSGLTKFDYRAFDPIARVTIENPVVAVRKDSPWNSLSDMMASARAKPGEIRLGNSGMGSHTHISAEAFVTDQRAKVLHVPFAAAQVVTSLLGGHIDALVQLPGALAPHVRAGTLKVIGTLSSTREPAFPTVPTALEQGIKFEADMWRGVAAPKGTPPAVLAKLEVALQKAVMGPEFKAAGEKNGFLPAYQPAREFAQTIAIEDASLAQLMAKVGLKLQ
jgi:tripartite-type tricarboxylate transporter receptor subunit TctC